MKHLSLLALIVVIALAAGSSIVAATPNSHTTQSKKNSEQANLARQAKITMERAREIALQRAPGAVESAELEREHGQLVYSFDIRNAEGTITEVQVNALTGKVARIEHENKSQEAAEKRKEQREKSTGGRRQ